MCQCDARCCILLKVVAGVWLGAVHGSVHGLLECQERAAQSSSCAVADVLLLRSYSCHHCLLPCSCSCSCSIDNMPSVDPSRCVVMFPSDDALLPNQLDVKQVERVIIIDSKWCGAGLPTLVLVDCCICCYCNGKIRGRKATMVNPIPALQQG